MSKKLAVAFLWHMHQPLYKDLLTARYYLPWVRLHATYSYLDMVSILDRFPDVKCTFNLTPSLMYQLQDISAGGDADDIYLGLSRKDADSLSEKDKLFILRNFFSASRETAIFPIVKYGDLFLKRGDKAAEEDIVKKMKEFSVNDMRDIQVFFNLAWCGFTLKERDPLIKDLLAKGGGYSEDEKNALLDRQKEIAGSILPAYRKLQDEGRIEVTTTPFYHPILPLVYRGDKKAQGFDFKEDAVWHVKEAVRLYEKIFGKKPVGMWPAEGGVSRGIIPILASCGIKWIATDEGILFESFRGTKMGRDDLVFSPFCASNGLYRIAMFFRDINLSNAISFRYARMPQEEAARDLLGHIVGIKRAVEKKKDPHILSIILDGENPWPYYPDGGKTFLSAIYGLLSSSDEVETVTPGKYLRNRRLKKIKNLKSGSWINRDFTKWIGSPQKNRAWRMLERAREDLFGSGKPVNRKALEELYIAEGSDWFWWYDEFGTELNFIFDDIFRMHLANIYRLIGKDVPEYLERPICGEKTGNERMSGKLMLPPVIDGKVTSSSEWDDAVRITAGRFAAEMARTDTLLYEIRYGMDRENLYVMVNPSAHFSGKHKKEIAIEVSTASPVQVLVSVPFGRGGKGTVTARGVNGKGARSRGFDTFSAGKVMEIKIPFTDTGALKGDEINFKLHVMENGNLLETWPAAGFLSVIVP